MYQVYACLAHQHDLRLVVVAGLICLLASWTTLSLARRSAGTRQRVATAWLAAAALVAGCGIWATHFIAMLAFDTGLPTGFAPRLTLVSALIAILVSGSGLALARHGGPARQWLGGAVLGLGVAGMHYAGMAALDVPATMSWDAGLVLVSLLLGTALSAAAIRTAGTGKGPARATAGTLLLTVAICAMHFTGMGALRLAPDPLLPMPAQQLAQGWLALGVTAAAGLILILAAVAIAVDQFVTDRAASEAVRLRTLVDAAFEGILIQVDGTVLDVNQSLAALVGRRRDELIERPVLELIGPELADRARAVLSSGAAQAYETELLQAGGGRVPVEVLSRPIEYRGRRGRVAAVRDISERRRAEARIRHLAHHDPLTGLPNRALFQDRVRQALEQARRYDEQVGLLLLDLDRFKDVNDSLGHDAGDLLLCETARRLHACLREGDTVARLGGDEFAVVLPHLPHPGGAAAIAEQITAALSEPMAHGNILVHSGASVGITLFPDDGDEPGQLLKNADIALYRAKAEGRGGHCFFVDDMRARVERRKGIENDLRLALGRGEIAASFQPAVRLADGQVAGFEALARWHHPGQGVVLPAEFLPVAEETGLIAPLGEIMLRQAAMQARACQDQGVAPGFVGVNVAGVQLRRGGFAALVKAVLAEARLEPSQLMIEVTEGVLLGRGSERVVAELEALHELGVTIALDDFGTGYASLTHLKRFPVNRLKIDRSFVRDLLTDPGDAAIVEALIGLGHNLGMQVVAEGVETPEQDAWLRRHGCDYGQGFLYGLPMPAADMLPFMRSQPLPHPPGAGKRASWSAKPASRLTLIAGGTGD